MNRLLEMDRQSRILEMLREDSGCSVREMAKRLFVSEATIRRDLRYLDYLGFVKRVYGGAVLVRGENADVPLPVRAKRQLNAKQVIGEKAARHVTDGMVIFLDASTTAHAMCEHLQGKKGLNVITNGMRTAETLGALNIKTHCVGGELLHSSLAFVGSYAEKMVREFHVDAMFFSASGLMLDGRVSDRSMQLATMHQVMLESSRQRYLLCDSTKLGEGFCYQVVSAQTLDGIISEDSLPESLQGLHRTASTGG